MCACLKHWNLISSLLFSVIFHEGYVLLAHQVIKIWYINYNCLTFSDDAIFWINSLDVSNPVCGSKIIHFLKLYSHMDVVLAQNRLWIILTDKGTSYLNDTWHKKCQIVKESYKDRGVESQGRLLCALGIDTPCSPARGHRKPGTQSFRIYLVSRSFYFNTPDLVMCE